MRFGILGIPALVVINAMSGKVVVSNENSHREVPAACRGATVSIGRMIVDGWLKCIPPESQMIIETHALSCRKGSRDGGTEIVPNLYLERVPGSANVTGVDVGDTSLQIREVFDELFGEGMEPNVANVRAIERVGKARG